MTADTRRPGSWAPVLPLALAAALAYFATRRDWGEGGELIPWLGAAVAFLGFLPALRWGAERRARPEVAGSIPFFPTLGCLFALYFGAPALMGDTFLTPTLEYDNASVERALWLSLGGWLACLLGWRLGAAPISRLRPLRLELDWGRARRYAPVLLAIGFGAVLIRRSVAIPGGLVQPVRFLEMLLQAGLAVLVLSSLRRELNEDQNLLLWLFFVPLYLFLQVGAGSVAQLAYAGVFLLFLAWGAGRRVPMFLLACGALVMLVMRGHVHEFRGRTWHGAQAEAGAWEKSVIFVEVLTERYEEDGMRALAAATEEVRARVSHLSSFSHVTKLTPERVAYWGGATYRALPSTLVPRLLWPGKPSKRVGQDFGHRYSLLAPNDRTTAVNLPQIVELYANFGARGVLAGMFALGLLYRLLHRWWNTYGTGAGTLVLAALLLSRLILIESDFSLVYGALLQNAVLLILLFRWLRPTAPPAAAEPEAAPTS